jgi:hypothetical protein
MPKLFNFSMDFGQGFQVLGEKHCVKSAHTIDFGSCVPSFKMH